MYGGFYIPFATSGNKISCKTRISAKSGNRNRRHLPARARPTADVCI